MGGAVRRVTAALLGALDYLSSHTRKPPTEKAEGANKEENADTMHSCELKGDASGVKQ